MKYSDGNLKLMSVTGKLLLRCREPCLCSLRPDRRMISRNGVICEDDGTLVSISFPLTRATDPLGDPVDSDRANNYLH